jgi:hypothetical protein
MARRTHAAFPIMPSDRFGDVVTAIERDSGLERALSDRRETVRVRRFICPSIVEGRAVYDNWQPYQPAPP